MPNTENGTCKPEVLRWRRGLSPPLLLVQKGSRALTPRLAAGRGADGSETRPGHF